MAGAFALSAGSAGSSAPADPAEQLRLDQIQVVGTHNSYALPIDRRVVALAGPKLRAMKEAMAGKLSPAQQAALRDEHPGPLDDPIQAFGYIQQPIEAQLQSGVRSIELDLQPDPKGGLYADPAPYRALRAQGARDLLPIYERELRQPKVEGLPRRGLRFPQPVPDLPLLPDAASLMVGCDAGPFAGLRPARTQAGGSRYGRHGAVRRRRLC